MKTALREKCAMICFY